MEVRYTSNNFKKRRSSKYRNVKNASPSLHWLSSSATGKARSAIRRYWQDKSTENSKIIEKNYSSTIEVDLPHKPGVLGHITSLIGLNKGNIVNLEIVKGKKNILLSYLTSN